MITAFPWPSAASISALRLANSISLTGPDIASRNLSLPANATQNLRQHRKGLEAQGRACRPQAGQQAGQQGVRGAGPAGGGGGARGIRRGAG